MCSLFHAFILCQLWTVYLENVRPSTSSKVRSMVHMCSLFHAFILCQLWTVYLENVRPFTGSKVRSRKKAWVY